VIARRWPQRSEFFAPLPLAALALLVTNDVFLKPHFHNAWTGKLSDVAVCFLMPLFVSELLGLAFGWPVRRRLRVAAIATAAIFTALEVIPPVTRWAIAGLSALGPVLGISGRFRMTADRTDLLCLLLIPLAVRYGDGRSASRQQRLPQRS
jgi:hypothetical protein